MDFGEKSCGGKTVECTSPVSPSHVELYFPLKSLNYNVRQSGEGDKLMVTLYHVHGPGLGQRWFYCILICFSFS